MAFADLKNDFVFRRIFATHPDILRGLLNDLLDRRDEAAIVSLEYMPRSQLPLAEGAKLSILDVRCKDRAGTTFVAEMQLIHHPGFINRVVYNACKAYAGQLKAGDWYTKLMDVVAISICDFELWPDAQQKKQKLPTVPMLRASSRGSVTPFSASSCAQGSRLQMMTAPASSRAQTPRPSTGGSTTSSGPRLSRMCSPDAAQEAAAPDGAPRLAPLGSAPRG